jgi:hypothetical protein
MICLRAIPTHPPTHPPTGGRELLDWQLPHLTATEAWQLGLGALGFLMYKVALLSVTLAPLEPSSKEPARQLGKN